MTIPRYSLTMPLLTVIAFNLCGIVGCGRGHPVAQVRGKVVFTNGALPNTGVRLVRLEPTADSSAEVRKGASGSISDDGSFELYTRRPGDGVHLGSYAVTFAFYRGAMDQRSLIPQKYTRATTTPYHVVVEDDIDDLEFEIEPMEKSAP